MSLVLSGASVWFRRASRIAQCVRSLYGFPCDMPADAYFPQVVEHAIRIKPKPLA
jgi:vacuolar-type H+-ATPase catalytic subunit A/Vma1